MLALKRLGFSLDEMAQMTMADFIAITDVAVEAHEEAGKPAGPRRATQEDIDRLLG